MSAGIMRGIGRGSGGLDNFPDPFLDVASLSMPQSMRNALQWCEYIYMSHGTYRMALERIISYFLTDIEFVDDEASDDEKDKWEEFMRDTLDVFTNLQCCYRNRMCYGNGFTSVLVPFKRFLVCPKCGSSYPLKVVYNNKVFNFAWQEMKFTATCPVCKVGRGYRGPWKVDDKPDDEERKIRIKHWNPHEIEILEDYYTNETAYLWRIPEDYKQQVRKGNLYHLERASVPVLDAIKKNQMFRFNADVIHHMKEPTLAGIRNRGWGIPRTLSNFRQIYYVQVLRRYNEAIALDYVIPFRLITPAPRPGAGGAGGGAQTMDPMMAFNMGDFRSSVQSMLRKRRRDPASWNVLPFPVQYQMLGGDASNLAPVDLIANGTEQLLNDVGTPVELYKGTLQLQTAPVALRLFEATWHPLVHDGNNWLRWLARQVGQIMSWEVVKPTLQRVTIADDIQKQMMRLQLMMGQQVSGTDGLKSVGLDWKQQQKRMSEEARFQAEQQARMQEEMDQAGFAAQMAKGNVSPGPGGGPQQSGPGGAPPGQGGGAQGGAPAAAPGMMPGGGPVDQWLANMGPNTPVQPQEMVAAADSLAQQLLGQPEGVKDSQLRLLKQKNEVMHAIVRSRLDTIRNQAKTQGGAQVLAQAGGQAPA